jgi:hypothetical protein
MGSTPWAAPHPLPGILTSTRSGGPSSASGSPSAKLSAVVTDRRRPAAPISSQPPSSRGPGQDGGSRTGGRARPGTAPPAGGDRAPSPCRGSPAAGLSGKRLAGAPPPRTRSRRSTAIPRRGPWRPPAPALHQLGGDPQRCTGHHRHQVGGRDRDHGAPPPQDAEQVHRHHGHRPYSPAGRGRVSRRSQSPRPSADPGPVTSKSRAPQRMHDTGPIQPGPRAFIASPPAAGCSHSGRLHPMSHFRNGL